MEDQIWSESENYSDFWTTFHGEWRIGAADEVDFIWGINDEKHGTMDQPMDAPLGGLLESRHTV